MSMKIILDKSIFHGEKFNLLLKSPLLKLANSFKLSIYGSPILIEETLRLWFKGQRDIASKQLKYILDITNARWFRSREEIWAHELNLSARPDKYFFMSNKEVEETKGNLAHKIIKGNLDPDEEPEFRQQLAEQYRKDNNIRNICLKMRADVSDKLKKQGKTRKNITQGFTEYYLQNVDLIGTEIIHSHLSGLTSIDNCIQSWKSNKDRYPYLTLWVKAFLFVSFHAMSMPNDRVDRSAVRDIGQLVDMQGLDVIVSDDNRFMKSAFLEFYKDKKQFMNLSDFLSFIASI